MNREVLLCDGYTLAECYTLLHPLRLFFGLLTRWVSWCSLEMQGLTGSTVTTEGVYAWLGGGGGGG